ncbi:metal-dependent hydrolase [Solirubrobacter soli]|uniref:metal-dependent hydrolase n=1 Tax=Solirubrobacter soli TaxID=363832 RepID=UPI000A04C762|nr:metal-dependent hydrolase [Solirubrobacter soli]
MPDRSTTARRVQVYSDPLQHVLIAAAVVAPFRDASVVRTAAVASIVIDADHIVAARSVRVRHTTGLDTRPRSHSLITALGAGAAVAAVRGAEHGWATFAALTSHLLHDAGDRAAPTPLLWPFAPARQLGRRRQLAGTALLALASVAVSRALAAASADPPAAGASGGGAAAPPRTA